MTRRAIVIGAALCSIGLPPLFVLINAASFYSVNRTNGTLTIQTRLRAQRRLHQLTCQDCVRNSPILLDLSRLQRE